MHLLPDLNLLRYPNILFFHLFRGPISWSVIYGLDLNTKKGLLLVVDSMCFFTCEYSRGLPVFS
jgi:hypothetical protein